MYRELKMNFRTFGGATKDFPTTIGFHQSSLVGPKPLSFCSCTRWDNTIDTRRRALVHVDTDNIVLVDETREGVNTKLERWRQVLESRGFKWSRSKIEYVECNFSTNEITRNTIELEEKEIAPCECLKYLVFIFQNSGDIQQDVTNGCKCGWKKMEIGYWILCDQSVPLKLKGKLYRMTIRPTLLYILECWTFGMIIVER